MRWGSQRQLENADARPWRGYFAVLMRRCDECLSTFWLEHGLRKVVHRGYGTWFRYRCTKCGRER